DALPRRDAADGIRHVQTGPLLPDDDRPDVRLGRRLDDRVDRVADEEADTFALENLGDCCRDFHWSPPERFAELTEFGRERKAGRGHLKLPLSSFRRERELG